MGELDAPAPCRNDLSESKRAWSGIEQSERCIGAKTWGNRTAGPR